MNLNMLMMFYFIMGVVICGFTFGVQTNLPNDFKGSKSFYSAMSALYIFSISLIIVPICHAIYSSKCSDDLNNDLGFVSYLGLVLISTIITACSASLKIQGPDETKSYSGAIVAIGSIIFSLSLVYGLVKIYLLEKAKSQDAAYEAEREYHAMRE